MNITDNAMMKFVMKCIGYSMNPEAGTDDITPACEFACEIGYPTLAVGVVVHKYIEDGRQKAFPENKNRFLVYTAHGERVFGGPEKEQVFEVSVRKLDPHEAAQLTGKGIK